MVMSKSPRAKPSRARLLSPHVPSLHMPSLHMPSHSRGSRGRWFSRSLTPAISNSRGHWLSRFTWPSRSPGLGGHLAFAIICLFFRAHLALALTWKSGASAPRKVPIPDGL